MKNYELKEFIKLVESADIVYGEVSLNAATKIPARVKKKSVLDSLKLIRRQTHDIGYYGQMTEDKRGRKILKVL